MVVVEHGAMIECHHVTDDRHCTLKLGTDRRDQEQARNPWSKECTEGKSERIMEEMPGTYILLT